MSMDVGPAAQQGVISTQVERVQNDRPTATQAPQPQEQPQAAPPPPPPVESGRGANVDTSA